MKLVSFTVEKYRSITKAHRIGLDNTTILVGPNNEGKSNILRALVAAMNILTRGRNDDYKGVKKLHGYFTRNFYNWELDYPIHLQKANPKGESIMILEFELSKDEINEFKRELAGISQLQPNKRFIGVAKVRLWFYNISTRRKPNKFRDWMRNKVGEAPVLYDSLLAEG